MVERSSNEHKRHRRSRSQGATRKVLRGNGRIRALMRSGVLLLVLLGLASAGVAAYSRARDALNSPVESVSVGGELRFTETTRIVEVMKPYLQNGLLEVDLIELKKVLEQEPWIRDADVEREWPASVHVDIAEHYPIARWGADGFLSQQGHFIETDNVVGLEGLPQLAGAAGDEQAVMNQYYLIVKLLKPYGLTPIRLLCDEKAAWELTLNTGVDVRLGRDQIVEKMRRVLAVYREKLQGHESEIKHIDARYNNGVAVQWDTAVGMQVVKAAITSAGEG